MLDPGNDGDLDTPVSIGGADCGEALTTIADSNDILSGTLTSFDALANGDCTDDGSTSCPGQPSPPRGALDGGVCPHELGNLAAQTLALTYNTLFFPNSIYAHVRQPDAGCGADVHRDGSTIGGSADLPPLTFGSTFFDVLDLANDIIDDADLGNDPVSVAEVEAMTVLLGHCVNQV